MKGQQLYGQKLFINGQAERWCVHFSAVYCKSVKYVSDMGEPVILNVTRSCALDIESQKLFNFFVSKSRHCVFENGWTVDLTPKKVNSVSFAILALNMF